MLTVFYPISKSRLCNENICLNFKTLTKTNQRSSSNSSFIHLFIRSFVRSFVHSFNVNTSEKCQLPHYTHFQCYGDTHYSFPPFPCPRYHFPFAIVYFFNASFIICIIYIFSFWILLSWFWILITKYFLLL